MRWTKFFILPVVLFIACVNAIKNDLDKIGSANWQPEWGLPVLSGEFSLGDYLDAVTDEVTISEDENGVVVIAYTGPDVTSDKAEDMINVPDQNYAASLSFDAVEVAGLPVNLTIAKAALFEFVVDTNNGDELDSMVVKSGLLNIGINGDFPASGEVEIIFHPIKVNGNTFSKSYSWSYSPGAAGQSFQETVDLSAAFIDFTNRQTTTNNFNFEVVLTINYEGQAITTGNALNVDLTMTNPAFRVVYGRFAPRTFITPRESVLLGLWENVNTVDFYLDNPQIDLNFKSSFGVPVTAQLKSLLAYNSQGDSLSFTGPIVTNGISVTSPGINQVGTYVETNIQINKDNSNITNIISFLPTELAYQFEGFIEPQASSAEQYVLDTSQVIGSYQVKMPLSGYVAEFNSNKEFDFDGSNLDPLNETKLILHTVNGLPVTVGIELIFLDANNNPLDTLFNENNLLNSGTLNSQGLVVDPNESFEELTLNEDQLAVLSETKKIVLNSKLYTGLTGAEIVKIRSADQVKLSLFIQTSLSF